MSLSACLATLALEDKEDAEMQQIFGNRIRNIEFIKKYYSCDHFHRIFTSRSIYLYLPDVKCMALSEDKFMIKDMPHISMLNKLLDQMISQNHILLFRGRTAYLPEGELIKFKVDYDTSIHDVKGNQLQPLQSARCNIILRIFGLQFDYTYSSEDGYAKLCIHTHRIMYIV